MVNLGFTIINCFTNYLSIIVIINLIKKLFSDAVLDESVTETKGKKGKKRKQNVDGTEKKKKAKGKKKKKGKQDAEAEGDNSTMELVCIFLNQINLFFNYKFLELGVILHKWFNL